VPTESDSDDILIRYLRGELAEAERERIEDRYFADDRLYRRLLMLEDRMLDSYVGGELPPDERDRFARLVERSPEQRRKVAFAEALRRRAQREAGAPPRRPWWEAVQGFFLVRTPALRVALAAAAVALVVGPLAYLQHDRRANTASRQAAARQPRPAMNTARTPDTTPQPVVPILAFVLLPLERGGGLENRVVIPRGEFTIRLQLDLEDDQIEVLNATIRTADGVMVEQIDGLKPESAGASGRAVFVSLPSIRLRDGQYVVRLRRAAADGAAELVGGYGFQVKYALK
jgi:hypothetical protein